jgi:hypothetical protein
MRTGVNIPATTAMVLSLLIASSFCTNNAANGKDKLHAIIVGDTTDQELGNGAAKNVDNMTSLVEAIADALGSDLNLKQIVGNDFNCAKLNAAVGSLAANSGDVVIFHYSGHGFREDGLRSRFPRLWCHGAPSTGPLLEDIALGFRSSATPPRMVWAIADACNITNADAQALISSLSDTQRKAYVKLFGQKTSGTMIMAGADMHQTAFYYPDGGQFSKNLLDALALEIHLGDDASC